MSHRNLAVALLASLLLIVCEVAYSQAQPTLLGILEDNPGHYAGEGHYRDVRVVFHRDGKGWAAFPSNCPDQKCLKNISVKFPPQVNWTVAFDGKNIGRIVSRTPQSFDLYSTVGQQNIVGNAAPPTIGKPSTDFAGFLGEPVYRPLVAVSEPNFRDPENWKSSDISEVDAAKLRLQFKRKYPMLTNCEKMDTRRYSDSNIKVAKSYRSERNWKIVQLAVKGCASNDERGDELSMEWYVVAPDGKVRYLDSNMHLVDAGDYDNNGKSELIFSVDAYNRGGYKLFYDDFTQKAVFEFSYH